MARPRVLVMVAVAGVLLPYLARLPGCLFKGPAWLGQYLQGGVSGALCLGAFNFVAVAAALMCVALGRRAGATFAVAFGYGFLAVAHGTLDLASDAQAAVALVFIPFYSIPFFVVGVGVGLVVRWGAGAARRRGGAG